MNPFLNKASHLLSLQCATILSLGSTLAMAGEFDSKNAPIADEPMTLLEKLWSLPVLVDDPNAPVVQKLAITGRYQGQIYALSSDQGDNEDYDTRRLWLGADMTVFEKLRIKGDVVIDGNDFSPTYNGLWEAYASWKVNNELSVNFGRREPPFTEEYGTSSKYIATFERSLLVNQLHPDNLAGAWINGGVGAFKYDLGIYSGELDKEFGSFSAGLGALASVGYDFAADVDGQTSLLRLDYLLNDGDADNEQLKPYKHSFSLNYRGEYSGNFDVHTDLLYATGIEGQSDVWGIMVMPIYHFTDKLEGVFRYHWANSNADNGLNLQSRYERKASNLDGTYGDEYHSFYGGLNYFIYEHKLKLMTGVEYSIMDDNANDGGEFSGWTGFGGLRLYF